MFTGLIQEIGKVKDIKKGSNSSRIIISAKEILKDMSLGDSVSTDGICLTVVAKSKTDFTLEIMAETLQRAKEFKTGDSVNLEAALRLSDRLGGHLVSGHVDGIGTIKSIRKEDIAYQLCISTTNELTEQMLKKGSIALDGVSLTLIDVKETEFDVGIIPHTGQQTTLLNKKIGHEINIETDMIGKYVLRLLEQNKTHTPAGTSKKMDMNFLAENGFI
jgi:riboflavin synthase